jgi:hypothetical protein
MAMQDVTKLETELLARIEATWFRTIVLGGSAMPTDLPPNAVTTYGIGPKVSYFFGPGQQALLPYVSGQAGVDAVRGLDARYVMYGGSAGVLYLLTRSVGLDASVFYRLNRGGSHDPYSASHRFVGRARPGSWGLEVRAPGSWGGSSSWR